MNGCAADRAVLVVVEGLDGVGKSSLSQPLVAALGALHLTTPGIELRPVRPVVDAALAEHPAALQLFYAATVLAASAKAESALAAGRSVVIDRYWLSTWVYQAGDPCALDLGSVEARLRCPDLTVYVYVPTAVRWQRLEARGMTPADVRSLHDEAVLRERYEDALRGPIAGPVLRLDSSRLSPRELVDCVLGALGRAKAA